MKKKFDALLGKSLNASKLKNTVKNALARIATLKKQHEERWREARSNVVQLLNLDHHESAVLRVDHVIREQNFLDALVIIEGYCMLLMERIALVKSSIECPEELKEAIASLVFAASRFGQLPELQKICKIFLKKYGKEFIGYANDLHNNCGVNPKIAKKLQTRRATVITRLKVLKQIAAEHSINLQLEGENSLVAQENIDAGKVTHFEGHEPKEKRQEEELFSAYLKARSRYKDVKQATRAACELATQAAAAAKVAMELSQTKLLDKTIDGCNHQEKCLAKNNENVSLHIPNKSFRRESNEAGPSNTKAERQRATSVFTSESDPETNQQLVFKIPDQTKTTVMEAGSDGKEDESKSRLDKQLWWKQQDWDAEKQLSSFTNEFLNFCISDAGKNDGNSYENSKGSSAEGSSRGRRPISVRTRGTRGARESPSRGRRLSLS